MQKLLDQNTVPPDGFRAYQPETRTWVRAPDYFNLFEFVKAHRKANNLPLGNFWMDEVEDALCQMLPPGFCAQQGQPGQFRRNNFTRIGWEDVVSGTKTVASWAAGGLQTVDQALADRRADTCSRCMFNVNVGGLCAACQHLQNLAAQFTKGKQSTHDYFLKACSICKCSLRVKIWVPIENVAKGTPDLSRFPDWCWIPKEINEARQR